MSSRGYNDRGGDYRGSGGGNDYRGGGGGNYRGSDYRKGFSNSSNFSNSSISIYEIPTPSPLVEASASDIDKTPHLIFSKYPYGEQWPETPNNHIKKSLSKYANSVNINTSEYSSSSISSMDHGKFVYILMSFQSSKRFYVDALFKFASEAENFIQNNPKMKFELKYFIYFFRLVSIVNALKHNRESAKNIDAEPIYKKAAEALQSSLQKEEIIQKQHDHYLSILKLWFANYLDVSDSSQDDALYYYREVLIFCLQNSPFTEDLYFKTLYNLTIYFIKLKSIESAVNCFESLFYIATAESRLSKYLSTKTKNIGRLAFECSELLYKNREYDRAKDIILKVLDKNLSSPEYTGDLKQLLNDIRR